MRTTVSLDDDLLAKAQSYTGLTEKSAILREALTALVQREAAWRSLGLEAPSRNAKQIPRRRPAK